MSQTRALAEIVRFLSTASAEVLSVSGRWGVGKTYAWDQALSAHRAATPLRRYAYVSVFGLRSLDELKTAIVQSTVSLDGKDLEPTVDSFVEHVSSAAGLRKLGEELGRKGLGIFSRGVSAIPYAGKLADLLAPGAALLIRNQIICVDDLERAGQGLNVADILGLVSSLRERRGCKILLLLNENGLGDQAPTFQKYLEKVVDQAVRFEPTAQESAAAALNQVDALAVRLGERTTELGVKNIRVIRRIRRFLSFVEAELVGLHDGVTEKVVHSIALLGWCVFEPALAPSLERIKSYNGFSGLFSEEKRTDEELRIDKRLREYGFSEFDPVDAILLGGLEDGAFDLLSLRSALTKVDSQLKNEEVQAAIAKPWSIYGNSLEADPGEFLDALVESIEKHGEAMSPTEASGAFKFLRELGRTADADRLTPIYVAAQDGRPREFFAGQHDRYGGSVDRAIAKAFEEKLADMPLVRDPAAILVDIGSKNGWNPNDLAYLATISVDDYRGMIKRLRGSELQTAINTALRFADVAPIDANGREVSKRMAGALRSVAAESALNRMRVASYLNDEATEPGVRGDLQAISLTGAADAE